MQSSVSIIIVNWNGKKWLKDCLDSVFSQTYKNFEVIFVDNSSTDASVDFVKKNYSRVRVIENKSNLGFVLANNKAAKIADGEYIFFLNNDTKLDSRVLSRLVKEMEENPKIGIGGCKMMSYDGRKHFHTGIGIDIFGYPIVKGKVFYVEGSALMIRKQLFKKLRGFDSKYFMFHEDIDLAWRTWLCGYQVVSSPSAIVYHVAGASAGGMLTKGKYKSSYLRRYYSERNNVRTILKNYSFTSLLWILPGYLLINLFEILVYLLTLNFKMAFLYLKGYLWNIFNLNNTLSERKAIQSLRKVSDKKIIERMYHGSGKLDAFTKVGVPTFQ